jgi:hypothetical protein
VDIVGCTTTGEIFLHVKGSRQPDLDFKGRQNTQSCSRQVLMDTRNTNLLIVREQGLDARVMLVEEAGQVLEAHILGSLVPTIQHLILIGDPLQLRPTLNNYGLSIAVSYTQALMT